MAKRTAYQKVLSIFKRYTRKGATTDEVEKATGLSHQTASARVNELYRDGYLEVTGQTRLTRYGRPAHVYFYTEPLTYDDLFSK